MTQHVVITPELILDEPTRQFLSGLDAGPAAVAVTAPGGHGKSAVLAELARRHLAAGRRVVTTADSPHDSAALLIDDAHLLGPEQLDALCRIAEAGDRHLAVAYRPWPRPAGLGALAELLGRGRLPLTLAPLEREQVRTHLRNLDADPRLADFVHEQTGGVPRLVDVLGAALAGAAEAGVPPDALSALRPELDRLDPQVARYLLAVEAGAGLHGELLADLLGGDAEQVAEVMEAARATGLLGADGGLLPLVARALGVLVPAERRAGVRQRLAESQHRRGGPVLELAGSLLGSGVAGAGVAAVFRAAADEAQAAKPALAAKLYAAAVAAGTAPAEVTSGWARASARSGDLDHALRLAEQAIATEDAADRAGAAEVAGAALAHRGQAGRSAEFYRWAGPGHPAAFAAIGALATGQPALAESLPGPSAADGPPTMLAGAAMLMAEGARESVRGSTTAALSQLVRAAALLEPAGTGVLLPDSPAALAAIVGLHGGELDVAESTLDRAVSSSLGGPLLATRHRLLLSWIMMARGRTAPAGDHLLAATTSGRALEPRDWLFAVALEVGLARRASDITTLRNVWSQVCEAVLRHPVDLFTLLPLGEFVVAAARVRDLARLRPHVDEAWSLLGALGDPPLWTTALRWSCLHAAIMAEQPDEAEKHATALAANAEHCTHCAVLAAAAVQWLCVVAGNVDAAEVEVAARALSDAGLWWDGARLAGQAAVRTADRTAMVRLLDCARVLQGKPARGGAPAAAQDGTPAAGVLSDREREVAGLVLAGLTYKQVGDRLFISAKTVEHHVARMRQKLGATSRSELLDQLRRYTGA